MSSYAGFSADDLLWEKRRRKYRGGDDVDSQLAGFVAFCAELVHIKHPQGRRLLRLRQEQIAVARSYIAADKTIALKARQIGFTTVTMAFCLWRALLWDEWDTILLNSTERNAQYNLGMASFAYDAMDPWAKAHLPQRKDNNVARLTFDNGSRIESFPSNNNPARGRTARLMILDEWAFMPNPDEAWASIEPAADVGGQIIVLSTANGWGNMFHQFWQRATSGDNGFAPLFFPWSAVPERDQAWYEAKRRELPEWQLAQEYPSDPDEAFIKSGNVFFSTDAVSRQEIRKPQIGNLVNAEGLSGPRGRLWAQNKGGYVHMFEMPRPKGLYVIGADVAEGLQHGDYSSAHVLDCAVAPPGAEAIAAEVAHWHGHIEPDAFAYELAALGYWYGTALIAVEANNHGGTVLKALQRIKYPRLYVRRTEGSVYERQTERLGWWTSAPSKARMMDELDAELRNGGIQVHSEGTIAELKTYKRNEKGSLEGSPWDDRVISLAIANQMRVHANAPEFAPREAPREFTLAWFERALDDQRRIDQRRTPIGAHNVR